MDAGMIIELDAPGLIADEEGTIALLDDGALEISPDQPPPMSAGDPADHNANLAEHIAENDLQTIGEDLYDAFENDKGARAEWQRRLAKGIEVVGFAPPPEDGVIEGFSSVTYPIIAEAIVQFNARALDEIFPAAGPVKAVVIGKKTAEKEAQAERVQDYMNYQILEEDKGWQDEDDRLLMNLPLTGMGWKKVYHDARLNIRTSKYVPADEVYAPYSATAMCSIPRLCHRYAIAGNDLLFEQRSGNWRMCDLQEPPGDDEQERGEVKMEIDAAEGSTPGGAYENDRTHYILEFYVDYDLKGFEHVDEQTQEPTGFALPYIITVEENSRKVLKISRNWKKGDERFRKRINLTPFRFLPGLGFYGFGFLHVIGSLNEAATGALRAMLDTAARNNFPGGLITKDVAGIKTGTISISPGEYEVIDATAEELVKGIYTPPTHPVPDALFKLLGLLVEAGKSFTSTTEAMTGAAPSTGPVGTMVALIEQGSKVFSGIHKRLHKSKRDEYRLLAELNAENIPAEGYPYDVGIDPAESRAIFAQDFGPAVDVLPVSDPNIFSAQQRIAIAQALLELATTNPDLYDRREAHRRMLEALKVPSIDDVLLNPEDKPHQDPVAENMEMIQGRPAKAFPDQAHQAHIKVHIDFMLHPQFGGHPDFQELVAPVMQAHVAEHAAFLYQQHMLQLARIPPAPEGEDEEMDQQMQNEIAIRAAAAGEQFAQMQGLPPPPPDPAQQMAEAEMALKQQDMEMKREQGRAALAMKVDDHKLKAAAAVAEEQRAAASFTADEQRRMVEWMNEQRRIEQEHEATMQRDEEAADQRLKLDKERATAQAAAAKAKAKAQPKGER